MMNLAHRKTKDERHVTRTDSFSKTKRARKVVMPPLVHHQWRKIVVAVTFIGLFHITLVPMLLHSWGSSTSSRHLSIRRHMEVHIAPDLPKEDSPWYPIALAAKNAERNILDFFHGDERSLENGTPVGGSEESMLLLTKRLSRKIALCHDASRSKSQHDEDCALRVAFIGSAQMAGRDVFYKDTFPFKTEQRLRPIAQAAGLKLQVMNHAQDNDISREGPQKAHMCVSNLIGKSIDVIAWDLDESMQNDPPAQFEAFVRWAFASDPAMILVNRGGPHGRSRRGKKKKVIGIGVGHDAEIWDDMENIPEQREEDYIGSDNWKKKWDEGRNSFWSEIFDKYSPMVDFVGVDPVGSIWHLDHLQSFSNAAFDTGKALPLLDCGQEHEAPCDQIPPFIAKKLAAKNVSLDSFPQEAISGGEVCGALYGCRHIWYGGTRSHELRGELNALPIVRALRSAAGILSSPTGIEDMMLEIQSSEKQSKQRALSLKSLPPPTFCSEVFCNRIPNCITSYLPNLGLELKDAIQHSEEGDNTFAPADPMPRLGGAHFADDPEWAVDNLEKRNLPLGYTDRKHAYRLSLGDGTKRLRPGANKNATEEELEYEPEDAATASVAFTSNGNGPVVLCEPPCFIDSCAKRRRMPMFQHVILELDGQQLEVPSIQKPPVEVSGALCKIIADEVSEGSHVLRITTMTKYPFHVLFSHVIAFF
ncbi:expressed unknown protein [Seminavis robusta]|uniref:Uncharacterized protein n=1 Tax=Seminavis robusta TaxID=568900 RepID=A0A9N8DZS7_9STRA|nr:expressed unknown protein [Seminavis robusta]|eukprot:Sro372_g128740.1 n/a (703) ;mRNA; r:17924-20405